MNNRVAPALAFVGSLLLGPAALAAPVESASAPGHEQEPVGYEILDHGQDDHDHDGDGRPDHDPEDHEDEDKDKDEDKDEKPKPKDDDD